MSGKVKSSDRQVTIQTVQLTKYKISEGSCFNVIAQIVDSSSTVLAQGIYSHANIEISQNVENP